jgi:hypothetical protein
MIRLYKTQVSVTQSASDWALGAKSHSNIMVLIKSVLNDQSISICVLLAQAFSNNIEKNSKFLICSFVSYFAEYNAKKNTLISL